MDKLKRSHVALELNGTNVTHGGFQIFVSHQGHYRECFVTFAVKKNIRVNQQKRLLVLRGVRVEAGLTQSKLALRLGTDQTFISKYESGERRLDILELREVCQAIGIDFVSFIHKLDQDLKTDS